MTEQRIMEERIKKIVEELKNDGYSVCPDCGNRAPAEDIHKYGRCGFCHEERRRRIDECWK